MFNWIKNLFRGNRDSVVEVTNRNAYRSANKKYVAVLVSDNGEEYPLLLTQHEFDRARKRVHKNREDVPADWPVN